MGKRGPKPAGEFGDQRAVLSTRITSETREALEQAARRSGRSLSSEVEFRLRRSFEDDVKIVESLGGQKMYAMLRAIAAAMTMAGSIFGLHKKGDDWLDSPDDYDRAFWATVKVLDTLRPDEPPGSEGTPSAEIWRKQRRKYGVGFARMVIEGIADAEPVLASPSEKIPDQKRLYRRIASDLGAMRTRAQKGKSDGTR